MARLEIQHTTRLSYREPIAETYMEMRVRPLDGVGQKCSAFSLDVRPASDVRSYRDGFGNHVLYFNHLAEHERVEVRARATVETGVDGADPEWQVFPEDFLAFRPPVLDLPGVRRIAAKIASNVAPEEPEAMLEALTAHINTNFQYRREITSVFTQVDEVLRLRRGVCQDFAHLFVAVSRALAIPCRYVSGYIHSEGGRGAGATHAWAEAWVPGKGWLGFDPTNPMRASEHHVRVATGRDYRDVPPTRGIYLGRAAESMEVTVEMKIANR